jgi:hypothetical protein
VNNLNIDLAGDFVKLFQPFLHKNQTFVEVFTDEGLFHIERKHVYQLLTHDEEVIPYPNFFKNVTLLADPSWFSKQKTTSLCGSTDHAAYSVHQYIYKMPTHTHVQLVIEFISKEVEERPRDVYFEIMNIEENKVHANNVSRNKSSQMKARVDQQLVEKRDIDDIFVKNELIEFLSYLF